MLRKLTEADTGHPLYVNPSAVIAIDVPPQQLKGNGRVLLAGWPSPVRIHETPDQAFAILCPAHPNSTQA